MSERFFEEVCYSLEITLGIDPSYKAKLFQLLMKKLCVKKLRATGYNPRENGLTEKKGMK